MLGPKLLLSKARMYEKCMYNLVKKPEKILLEMQTYVGR